MKVFHSPVIRALLHADGEGEFEDGASAARVDGEVEVADFAIERELDGLVGALLDGGHTFGDVGEVDTPGGQ